MRAKNLAKTERDEYTVKVRYGDKELFDCMKMIVESVMNGGAELEEEPVNMNIAEK